MLLCNLLEPGHLKLLLQGMGMYSIITLEHYNIEISCIEITAYIIVGIRAFSIAAVGERGNLTVFSH